MDCSMRTVAGDCSPNMGNSCRGNSHFVSFRLQVYNLALLMISSTIILSPPIKSSYMNNQFLSCHPTT